MKYQAIFDKLVAAVEQDPKIIVNRAGVEKTLGSDPRWLAYLGLDKACLQRLERLGHAIKARYEIQKTKEHRVRWILLTDNLPLPAANAVNAMLSAFGSGPDAGVTAIAALSSLATIAEDSGTASTAPSAEKKPSA